MKVWSIPRYRTFSDTALAGFTEALESLGIRFAVDKHCVETGHEDVDALAAEFGVVRQKGNKGENQSKPAKSL